jgi:hypothetical protein
LGGTTLSAIVAIPFLRRCHLHWLATRVNRLGPSCEDWHSSEAAENREDELDLVGSGSDNAHIKRLELSPRLAIRPSFS